MKILYLACSQSVRFFTQVTWMGGGGHQLLAGGTHSITVRFRITIKVCRPLILQDAIQQRYLARRRHHKIICKIIDTLHLPCIFFEQHATIRTHSPYASRGVDKRGEERRGWLALYFSAKRKETVLFEHLYSCQRNVAMIYVSGDAIWFDELVQNFIGLNFNKKCGLI